MYLGEMLNNITDIEVLRSIVKELLYEISEHKGCFTCQAQYQCKQENCYENLLRYYHTQVINKKKPEWSGFFLYLNRLT